MTRMASSAEASCEPSPVRRMPLEQADGLRVRKIVELFDDLAHVGQRRRGGHERRRFLRWSRCGGICMTGICTVGSGAARRHGLRRHRRGGGLQRGGGNFGGDLRRDRRRFGGRRRRSGLGRGGLCCDRRGRGRLWRAAWRHGLGGHGFGRRGFGAGFAAAFGGAGFATAGLAGAGFAAWAGGLTTGVAAGCSTGMFIGLNSGSSVSTNGSGSCSYFSSGGGGVASNGCGSRCGSGVGATATGGRRRSSGDGRRCGVGAAAGLACTGAAERRGSRLGLRGRCCCSGRGIVCLQFLARRFTGPGAGINLADDGEHFFGGLHGFEVTHVQAESLAAIFEAAADEEGKLSERRIFGLRQRHGRGR